jgi:hypothetical protein
MIRLAFVCKDFDNVVDSVFRNTKGNGDSVKMLSFMYGCDSEKFSNSMKQNYGKISPAANDATFVMVNINNVITDSPELYSNCHNVL